MSFDQKSFATVGGQSSNTPKIYSYQSPDTLSQVTAAGYFNAKRDQLSVGDWLFSVLSDGNNLLQIQSDTSTASKSELTVAANRTKIINTKDDLPAPSGGIITLETDTNYVLGDDVDIGTDRIFVISGTTSWTSENMFGATLTYTGTGAMFNGIDSSFNIFTGALSAPNGQIFQFQDSVSPGVNTITIDDLLIRNAAKFGTFTDMASLVITVTANFNNDDGVSVFGSTWRIISIIGFGQISTSASFVGIDLGTASSTVVTLIEIFVSAPAGAVGITGAANSANVTAGNIGRIRDSNFVGGVTPLTVIVPEDFRWSILENGSIPDTILDAMVSLNANATETVIASTGVAVQIPGTWSVERQSHFIALTDGTIQYIGERDFTTPVDFSITQKSASGTNKATTTYIALNGSIITNSGRTNEVGQNNPQSNTVLWQLTLSEGDILSGWHANDSDTVNLIAVDALIRVR